MFNHHDFLESFSLANHYQQTEDWQQAHDIYTTTLYLK